MVATFLPWGAAPRRALPWRAPAGEAADPYRVWLSEILLQQTTAAGAAHYFLNFVARWPDVEALAAAPLEAIMQAFAGLGYYSRARNLHACAKAIVARGGGFPRHEAELRALPGVGPYTAAAIAAIAFEAPTAPVDGNIARILSRLHAFETPVAKNRSAIEAAPRALKKPNAARVGAAFYARRADGAFLARRRPPHGLLGATMELPGGAWAPGDGTAMGPQQSPFASQWRLLRDFLEHVFKHFALRLVLFAAEADFLEPPGDLIWIAPHEIATSGFSGLMRKAAETAARLLESERKA